MAAAYGDDIDESGSAAAALHGGWMTLKDAIAGRCGRCGTPTTDSHRWIGAAGLVDTAARTGQG